MSRKKSTRQLIGIDDIKNGSVVTADGELAFYFVHPSNLNVLPEQGVRAKVQELLGAEAPPSKPEQKAERLFRRLILELYI